MTDVFRGVAGALNRVFGAPLRYVPQGGSHQNIHSVFRETPIVVAADDGSDVLMTAPTWRVPKNMVSDVQTGDQVQAPDGRWFSIVNEIGTGSPADDAFLVFELRELP